MKNLIDYLKDKIYYIMGATVLIIVILIIINSCSGNGNSYEKIEEKMVNAAKEYYSTRKNKLPREEDSTIKVTIGTLIDEELLKEIKDPKNKSQTCEGYVEVKKVDEDYSYIPFLTCKGNYEPKYLSDIVKDSKLDEYGNGVYQMDGEYVYRGDDVKNYVSFNNQLWRILKVDEDNDIELIFSKEENNIKTAWDTKYNSSIDRQYGVTTDYLHSDLNKFLEEYYKTNFTDESKAKIVKKPICIGKKAKDAPDNIEEECSTTIDEKVGLMVVSDYRRASLDENCTRFDSPSCANRNYIYESGISTWTLTSVSDNSYEVYVFEKKMKLLNAKTTNIVYPTIYLTKDTIILNGNGSIENPYVVK